MKTIKYSSLVFFVAFILSASTQIKPQIKLDKYQLNTVSVTNNTYETYTCAVVDGLDFIIAEFNVSGYSTATVDLGMNMPLSIRVFYKGSLDLDYQYQATKAQFSYGNDFEIN